MRRVSNFLYGCATVRRAALRRLSRAARRERDDAWVGPECENAAERDFCRLEACGYSVYRDFPGESFVISHVAVGPNGVFAAGAEHSAEAETGNGASAEKKAFFDGPVFRYPVLVKAASLARVRRQAAWLSWWLENRIGETVAVYPLLVVAGWLANRLKWGDIVFVSQHDYNALTARSAKALPRTAMERIRRQLDGRCLNAAAGVPVR
jgi:hypothetical protein